MSPATFLNASSQPPCPTGGLTVCVCVVSEYRSRFTSEETVLFCLRVMVGVIILYDHVHPAGAFVKTSNIDVRLSHTHTHGGRGGTLADPRPTEPELPAASVCVCSQ